MRSRRRIVPMLALALALAGGCRDRFLSTSYVEGNPLPSGPERFLFTDLDRMEVMAVTVSGNESVSVPNSAENGLSGAGPVLSSRMWRGVMPITRRQSSSYLVYTLLRADGTLYIPDWSVAMDPEGYVEGSLMVSPDLRWIGLFTLRPDIGGTSYSDIYLYTEELTAGGTFYDYRIGDASRPVISAPCFSTGVATALAFLRGSAGGVDLVAINIDGTGERVLLSGAMPADRTARRIDWSPDVTTIAVAGLPAPNTISFAPFSGLDVTTVTVPGVQSVRGLSWSPDGRSVVFSGSTGANEDIFTMKVADGSVRNITRTETQAEFAPDWSPDGGRIVYLVATGDGSSGHPAVYDLTLGTRRVYQGRTSGVFWER